MRGVKAGGIVFFFFGGGGGGGGGEFKYLMGVVDHFIIKFLFPSDKDVANNMQGMID